jgi:hypothetical protein
MAKTDEGRIRHKKTIHLMRMDRVSDQNDEGTHESRHLPYAGITQIRYTVGGRVLRPLSLADSKLPFFDPV